MSKVGGLGRFLLVAAIGLLVPGLVRGMAGIEGTMEYALDAPWRIEPSGFANGAPVYGPVPIAISIMDVNSLDLDHDRFDNHVSLRMDKVCSVVVRERAAGDGVDDPPSGAESVFPFSALDEVEWTRQRWPAPGDAVQDNPPHRLCRRWAGEDCSADDLVIGTSEWYGALSYMPAVLVPGAPLRLQIEVVLARRETDDCADLPANETTRLVNDVSIDVATAPMPRFGNDWLYGDLHYHSQGTDNEGESGYSHRDVLRAMGAMGLDFAFATEHASNSAQIVDVDVNIGDIFNIEFPPHEGRIGLRDMSDARFRFLHDGLNAAGGGNLEAGLLTTAAADEPEARLRPVPQLFLGGEVDLIPELPPGSRFGDTVPWGNHQRWSTDNLCFGKLFELGPISIDCDFFDIHLLEKTATDPDAVLVDDVQGLTVDFGRHHMIYLPNRAADRDAFVRSDTGAYGGAHRRWVDLKPEVEAHGTFFAAHSLSHYERDGFMTDSGPTDIPWTDHLYDQVWRSPAFLGLQFWNEDARLKEGVGGWSADTVTRPFPAPEHCAEIKKGGFPSDWICPTPGDDIGYERYDSPILGIPYAYLPFDTARSGFGTGLFHLKVAPPVTGRWRDTLSTVEEKLHHGAYTWDRLNHWGLDVSRTLDLSWLPTFLAPRRLFMAGGSDAHGDLDYRRTGYLIKTEAINDAALGKPRNLVDAGAPDGAALPRGGGHGPVTVHSQEQVAGAIDAGRFAITDGPALRLVVDRDRDGVADPDEPGMGDTVALDPSLALPLLVEWKSTPEFGPVTRIDLYLGARASEADLAAPAGAEGRTYAPLHPGVYHPSIPGYVNGYALDDNVVEDPPYNRMNDFYWQDPTGQLRFVPENGFEGTKSLVLDLTMFPAMQNRRADRFFVRAFAVTAPRESGCVAPVKTEGCLERYAFTNPIWAIDRTFLCSAAAGLDTEPPVATCNAPEKVWRRRLPRSFTAGADDLCGAEVTVHDVQCYAEHAGGTRTQRRCVVSTDGGTVRVDRADGTGTIVAWQATATDPAGNSSTISCQVEAVNVDPSLQGMKAFVIDRTTGGGMPTPAPAPTPAAAAGPGR